MARLKDGGSGCPGHHMRANELAAKVGEIEDVEVKISRARVDFESEAPIDRFLAALDKLLAPTKRDRAKKIAESFAQEMKEAGNEAIEKSLVAAEEDAAGAAETAAIEALGKAIEPLKEELIRGWEAEEELELVSNGRAA